MKHKITSLSEHLKEDFKYPFFLISLVTFLFVPSLVGQAHHEIVGDILFVLFIISSLSLISSESKVVLMFTYGIGLLGISAEIYHYFIQPLKDTFQIGFMLIMFIYFILLTSELIQQIFKSKVITLNVVLGAFTGYIMIGIIGYFIFRIIFILEHESFAIPIESSKDLIYFSFITLTTIGYGDISPITDSARNFAILLGLVGQFYNTVIIAIIIGKFLQK